MVLIQISRTVVTFFFDLTAWGISHAFIYGFIVKQVYKDNTYLEGFREITYLEEFLFQRYQYEFIKKDANSYLSFTLKKGYGLVNSLAVQFSSVQFSSVAQSCPTLCDTMNRSIPGLPVHHQLPEFTQTHVHQVSDAIQPSHPLSSPSPPAPNPSQHQSLFQ